MLLDDELAGWEVKTIWKWPINPLAGLALEMPRGAKLLHVDVQGSGLLAQPHVWALVDTEAPKVTRVIVLRGTGHDAVGCDAMPYIGTFLLGKGELVFHAFDGGETTSPPPRNEGAA